ncbi:unnamed protein product [Microthlaspi erraticum]|uniref:Uncharacterized protein n=1 Tax=Microthlaspi erraticum TaxID=1685480 RepID=A0A6D2JHW2_9BRAS|nr:unnamed protein product [Microthlaspi erraticum]
MSTPSTSDPLAPIQILFKTVNVFSFNGSARDQSRSHSPYVTGARRNSNPGLVWCGSAFEFQRGRNSRN